MAAGGAGRGPFFARAQVRSTLKALSPQADTAFTSRLAQLDAHRLFEFGLIAVRGRQTCGLMVQVVLSREFLSVYFSPK